MEVQETWPLTEAFSETFLLAPHSWKFEMRGDNLYAVLGRLGGQTVAFRSDWLVAS